MSQGAGSKREDLSFGFSSHSDAFAFFADWLRIEESSWKMQGVGLQRNDEAPFLKEVGLRSSRISMEKVYGERTASRRGIPKSEEERDEGDGRHLDDEEETKRIVTLDVMVSRVTPITIEMRVNASYPSTVWCDGVFREKSINPDAVKASRPGTLIRGICSPPHAN